MYTSDYDRANVAKALDDLKDSDVKEDNDARELSDEADTYDGVGVAEQTDDEATTDEAEESSADETEESDKDKTTADDKAESKDGGADDLND